MLEWYIFLAIQNYFDKVVWPEIHEQCSSIFFVNQMILSEHLAGIILDE